MVKEPLLLVSERPLNRIEVDHDNLNTTWWSCGGDDLWEQYFGDNEKDYGYLNDDELAEFIYKAGYIEGLATGSSPEHRHPFTINGIN